ncbi:MAG: methionyl-tRNA formyltransferase [Saprospiraceae bacterium]
MSLKIVFMGTPAFAVPSLAILLENGYDIVGVITAPDKYGGRGKKQLISSHVKKYAVEKGLNLLQPTNLKDPDFQANLKALEVDLQVVVAFRMLPVAVWDMPKIGTFNLHGSLLPKYRGAAPIHWAVINGETETGVTSFFLKHKIDTGDMLRQAKMPIGEDETTGEVHDRMMTIAAQVVLETVQSIERNDYTTTPQDETLVSSAPKIFTSTCEINFDQATAKIHNFIRGLNPFPTAWTTFKGKKLKIFRATKEITSHSHPVGEFFLVDNKAVKVSTPDGFIQLLEVQYEGRKRMPIKDFLNGMQQTDFLIKNSEENIN